MRSRSMKAARAQGIPALLLTAWAVSGCFSYVPVVATQPEPIRGRVIMVLAPRGTESVRAVLGENVRQIEGTVARSTSDSLFLRADYTLALTGERAPLVGTPVTVARADLLSVKQQRPAKGRTWLLIGAIVLGIVMLAAKVAVGSGGGPDDGPTPTPL